MIRHRQGTPRERVPWTVTLAAGIFLLEALAWLAILTGGSDAMRSVPSEWPGYGSAQVALVVIGTLVASFGLSLLGVLLRWRAARWAPLVHCALVILCLAIVSVGIGWTIPPPLLLTLAGVWSSSALLLGTRESRRWFGSRRAARTASEIDSGHPG